MAHNVLTKAYPSNRKQVHQLPLDVIDASQPRQIELLECFIALLTSTNTGGANCKKTKILNQAQDVARLISFVSQNMASQPSHNFPGSSRSSSGHGSKPQHLTHRQRQVLAQLMKGQSNKQIARSLNLAEGTVKVHVSALLRALGVANRTAAIAVGINLLQGTCVPFGTEDRVAAEMA
jgi:DNA-binding CsgD family transcriptional regulator